MKKPKKRDTGCPVAFALDTFGDRWSLIVLRDMLLKGYSTYGEFLSAAEHISTNVLADRLYDFIQDGLITKHPDPQNGRKTVYLPTQKAIDLIPVLVEFMSWSAKYDANTHVPAHILERIKSDRAGFVKTLQQKAQDRLNAHKTPETKQ